MVRFKGKMTVTVLETGERGKGGNTGKKLSKGTYKQIFWGKVGKGNTARRKPPRREGVIV